MAKKDLKKEEIKPSADMSLDEAKAYRAGLHTPKKVTLSQTQKREKFRVFWAQSKKAYKKPKELEEILWVHLVSTKNDEPENFDKGLAHFGLKKIG